MPTMTTRRCVVRPSTTAICSDRCRTSYPTPRRPYEPRNDRSLRSCAGVTPAPAASSSDDVVTTPSAVRPCSDPQVAGQPRDGRRWARRARRPPGRTRLRCPACARGPLRCVSTSTPANAPWDPVARVLLVRLGGGTGRGKGSAQPRSRRSASSPAGRRRPRPPGPARPARRRGPGPASRPASMSTSVHVGPGLRAHRPHHLPRLVAQMAAGPAVEHHTRHGLHASHGSDRSCRRTATVVTVTRCVRRPGTPAPPLPCCGSPGSGPDGPRHRRVLRRRQHDHPRRQRVPPGRGPVPARASSASATCSEFGLHQFRYLTFGENKHQIDEVRSRGAVDHEGPLGGRGHRHRGGRLRRGAAACGSTRARSGSSTSTSPRATPSGWSRRRRVEIGVADRTAPRCRPGRWAPSPSTRTASTPAGWSGDMLHGQAKADAVRAIAEQEGIDLAASYAYGDSTNDVAILSEVGFPCAINPDRRLRRYAADRRLAGARVPQPPPQRPPRHHGRQPGRAGLGRRARRARHRCAPGAVPAAAARTSCDGPARRARASSTRSPASPP